MCDDSVKVKMIPECECGNSEFIMIGYESEEPPKPGFLPKIDRIFTCSKCKKAIIFKGTYPTVFSTVEMSSEDVVVEDMTVEFKKGDF